MGKIAMKSLNDAKLLKKMMELRDYHRLCQMKTLKQWLPWGMSTSPTATCSAS